MNALKRITEKIKLWDGLDEVVTSDTVVVNLEEIKRLVIEDHKALVDRLRDSEITIYPAIGQAYKAYGAGRIDALIREIVEETQFYSKGDDKK